MSTVHQRRAELARLLRRALPSRFPVVKNTDHPLLIRGPDLIVATDRVVGAIFTPSAEERRSYSLLKARLVLSRLALPAYTRCFLVIERGDEALAQSFADDFADLIEWSTRARIVQLVGSTRFRGRHRDIPEEIAGEAQMRFSNAMTVMRLTGRFSSRPFRAALDEHRVESRNGVALVEVPRSRQGRPVIIRGTSSIGLEGVTFADMSDFDVNARLVRTVVDDQVQHAYVLDNGIPYSTAESTCLAVIRDWPISKRDPEKLIHAAAFAGLAFVLQQTRDQLPRFASELKRRLAR